MPHNDADRPEGTYGNPGDNASPTPATQVLIVDDNRPVREVVRSILDGEGYEVAEAGNGLEALKVLEQSGFDLVITDLVMPDCDGIELIRTIRTRYPATKILAISGAGSASLYLKTASLLGADDILEKPFMRSALLSALGGLLESVSDE